MVFMVSKRLIAGAVLMASLYGGQIIIRNSNDPDNAPALPGFTCTTTLSVGGNIASAVTNAANGTTICLNNGDYGSVALTNISSRTGFVTIRSVNPKGATIGFSSGSGEIWNTRFVRIQDVNLNATDVMGCSLNIEFVNVATIQNSGSGIFFDGSACATSTVNNYLVADSVFIKTQQQNFEGRISLRDVNGATIRNSVFTGTTNVSPTTNASDGIHLTDDTRNVTMSGNYFSDIYESDCIGPHCDCIQFVGTGDGNVIEKSYFEDSEVYLGFYDGGGSTIVRNNVFDTHTVGTQGFQIGGIQGMLMEHNTLRGFDLGIGSKAANSPNSGWIVQNNIFDDVSWTTASSDQDESCGSGCVMRYNLLTNGASISGPISQTNGISGTVVYAGTPRTFAGWVNWALAAGSPGKAAGNDGLDVGSLFFGQ